MVGKDRSLFKSITDLVSISSIETGSGSLGSSTLRSSSILSPRGISELEPLALKKYDGRRGSSEIKGTEVYTASPGMAPKTRTSCDSRAKRYHFQ